MRAAAFFETGPEAELTYADVPTPRGRPAGRPGPGPGMRGQSLRSRLLAGDLAAGLRLPRVLGADFVGTVAEAGGEVTSVGIGDVVTALRMEGRGLKLAFGGTRHAASGTVGMRSPGSVNGPWLVRHLRR